MEFPIETNPVSPVESSANTIPRGVAPTILLDQVRNTVPFLFEEKRREYDGIPHLAELRRAYAEWQSNGDLAPLDHVGYYRLCLCAHHATVASFVPTDVDNQIRFKLWAPSLPTETMRALAEQVMESLSWPWEAVSKRGAFSPSTGEGTSGLNGEWFSTSAAAYGALRKRSPEEAATVGGAILREVRRELQIMADCKQARDGIGLLKTAVVIAHNLGDLQRVFEMWNIDNDDPLLQAVEKEKARPEQTWSAELNRRWMANENHRHFALRGPKALRREPEYLLPIGPFFDEWGNLIARRLEPEEIGEIVEALIAGWQWLEKKEPKSSVGYARALAGIEESFPGGLNKLTGYLPARVARELKTGALRTLISVPRRRFEEQWKQAALNACR